ncbi:polysaccharide transporter, PST family [Paraburkholderia hospita]|nr:polysaccharide transporter, PST family [Paraburkholderia hospita]
MPTIVHRQPDQLGTVFGSAFALRLSVSAVALPLTWAGIAAGVTDPLVGPMLAGFAVTMLFREPLVGVINAWLQSMTYSKPQLLMSMTTATAENLLHFVTPHGALQQMKRALFARGREHRAARRICRAREHALAVREAHLRPHAIDI